MNVERPRKEKFIGSFYDKKEINTLFDIIQGHPLEVAIKLAAFYGLRREEIIGLKWNAIDFENSTLTIQHTVTECNLNGKHIEVASDTAKTDASLRTMPLVTNFREMLLAKKRSRNTIGSSVADHTVKSIWITFSSMRWANDGSHATCRTDSRESWNRMVFAVFAFTICATPVPVYCSRTTCR